MWLSGRLQNGTHQSVGLIARQRQCGGGGRAGHEPTASYHMHKYNWSTRTLSITLDLSSGPSGIYTVCSQRPLGDTLRIFTSILIFVFFGFKIVVFCFNL